MKISKARIILTLVLDVLLFGVLAFIICARVFNFFGPKESEAPVTALATPPTAVEPAVAETPVPDNGASEPASTDGQATEPAATEEPVTGLCGNRFPDKFSTGDVVSTATEYRSKNVGITVTYYEVSGVRYQVADIYLQDIQCLKTYGAWEGVDNDMTETLAGASGAILAVNGDYYQHARHAEHGWFVRNGQELGRFDFSTYTSDLCILYYDGSMEVIRTKEVSSIDYDAILAKYPYQIWYFGPSLLTDDGGVPSSYNSSLNPANPRTAIGYYEPGHYCLVTIEGTRGDKADSKGMTTKEMSELFASLGCKIAYNLDGGGSSSMFFQGAMFGNNDRSTSDIILVKDL